MKKHLVAMAHELFPPYLVRVLRHALGRKSFRGSYPSWAAARNAAGGYDAEHILAKVRDAVLRVKRREAACERDSVTFDRPQQAWPLLAGLLWAASRSGNKLSVLDFGGSLGSSFFQNAPFLRHLEELCWNVVEQPGFVTCGREHVAGDGLRFFYSTEECLNEGMPDLLLLSSVLQYLESPYAMLDDFLDRRFEYVIIDRTPFVRHGSERITVQTVAPEIYRASYPAWLFEETKLLKRLTVHYDLIAAFSSAVDEDMASVHFKGFLLRIRK